LRRIQVDHKENMFKSQMIISFGISTHPQYLSTYPIVSNIYAHAVVMYENAVQYLSVVDGETLRVRRKSIQS
jgi:hypothetical protein